MPLLAVLLLTCAAAATAADQRAPGEDRHGVILPSRCEVCKLLALEIKARMAETNQLGRITIGNQLDSRPAKHFLYKTSEVRMAEVFEEPNVCQRMLKYSLHKERKGSLRFARGTSQTFKTLEGLVQRGVKVDLGIPHELWKEPPAEINDLHKKCFHMLQKHEEALEVWFLHEQDSKDIVDVLCRQRELKHVSASERACLDEVEVTSAASAAAAVSGASKTEL